MRLLNKWNGLALAAALVGFAATPAQAATINLNDYLTNPSFETGNLSGWTVTPSGTGSVFVTNTPFVAPDGSHYVEIYKDAPITAPPLSTGSVDSDVTLKQAFSLVGGATQPGTNSYVFTFYAQAPQGLGGPNPTMFNVALLSGPSLTATTLCDGWGSATLTGFATTQTDNSDVCQFTSSSLPSGWTQFVLTYTGHAPDSFGNPLGIQFRAAGLDNGTDRIDLDVAGPRVTSDPVVPEPATMVLTGLGLVGTALVVRRRRK
jgi:hypothetical protein